MRPDAFERDIRKVLEEVEYRPSEESWQKMQQALMEGQQANFAAGLSVQASKKKPFWSISRAVAAACFGVLATGAILFYVNNSKTAAPGQQLAGAIHPATEHKLLAEQVNTAAPEVNRAQVIAAATVRNRFTATASAPGPEMAATHPLVSSIGETFAYAAPGQVQSAGIRFAPEMRNALDPVSAATERNERFKLAEDMGSKLYSAFDWSDNPEHNATFEDPFIYGVSVKGGLPKVGLMQFNAAMTVKRDWNRNMYTEANLDVSYTDVRYDKALNYRRNDNGSYTNLGNMANDQSNAAAVAGRGNTYTYGNHVIGIGLAVLGGYNVNKSFSVAVGADMYRNFNNKLVLEENNPLVEATRLKNTINPVKWINVWDAGARVQARYRLSDHLSLVAQYRRGLVGYIEDETGKKIRNSSVGLGLNISLNP